MNKQQPTLDKHIDVNKYQKQNLQWENISTAIKSLKKISSKSFFNEDHDDISSILHLTLSTHRFVLLKTLAKQANKMRILSLSDSITNPKITSLSSFGWILFHFFQEELKTCTAIICSDFENIDFHIVKISTDNRKNILENLTNHIHLYAEKPMPLPVDKFPPNKTTYPRKKQWIPEVYKIRTQL